MCVCDLSFTYFAGSQRVVNLHLGSFYIGKDTLFMAPKHDN